MAAKRAREPESRGRGRPPEASARHCIFCIRLTGAEKDLLSAAADGLTTKDGDPLTVRVWARDVLLRDAKRRVASE